MNPFCYFYFMYVMLCSLVVPCLEKADLLALLGVFIPTFFLKKAKGILLSPPSVCPSARPSVMLSPPKPLDEIQPNLVCELLT